MVLLTGISHKGPIATPCILVAGSTSYTYRQYESMVGGRSNNLSNNRYLILFCFLSPLTASITRTTLRRDDQDKDQATPPYGCRARPPSAHAHQLTLKRVCGQDGVRVCVCLLLIVMKPYLTLFLTVVLSTFLFTNLCASPFVTVNQLTPPYTPASRKECCSHKAWPIIKNCMPVAFTAKLMSQLLHTANMLRGSKT